jgi:hypothetical protein
VHSWQHFTKTRIDTLMQFHNSQGGAFKYIETSVLDDDLKKEELILTEELEKMLEAGLDSLESVKGIEHSDVLLRLQNKYSPLQF